MATRLLIISGFFISITFSLFSISGCGCDNGNPRNGEYKSYYGSNNYQVRIFYETKNCFGHGKIRYYYPNGTIEMQGEMDNGEVKGNFDVFNSQGVKQGYFNVKERVVTLTVLFPTIYYYRCDEHRIDKVVNNEIVKTVFTNIDSSYFDDNVYSYKLFYLGNNLFALNSDLTLLIFDSNLNIIRYIAPSLNAHDKIWAVKLKNNYTIEFKVWVNEENSSYTKEEYLW